MPNLRGKTWTTTTPAYVEDAQYWEDHLISDADAAKITTSVQSVNNTTPDAQGNVNIVALPSGGTAGQVLTKQSSAEGDADWENPASSGHTIIDENGDDMPYRTNLQFTNAEVTDDSANDTTIVDCKGEKGDPGQAATITVGTTTTLPAGSSATVTNSGTTSAAVFNFSIPKGADGTDGTDGVSITGIELISTSGKVKTYRISFSDGDYFDYQVTDGADGTGAGDMLKADYDPNSVVESAGGIPDYVASQAYTLPTAASNVLGGVKVGTNLSIDANGVLSATDTNTDALHDLTDVNISLPANGQVLTYDDVSEKWVNGSAPSTVDELSDLSDVTLTSPTDGQILAYDNNTGKWVNVNQAGGSIAGLSDVSLSSLSANQFLRYNATTQKWENYSLSAATTSNMGLIMLGDGLIRNGSKTDVGYWTNAVEAAAGTTTVTITDANIITSGTYDIYVENASNTDVNITGKTVSSGSITLTFDALAEATSFKIHRVL